MMTKISYSGYRFPPEIIQQAIWLYVRFTLSFRDVEDLVAERGIMVSYETIRRWVNHFGPLIAADLRRRFSSLARRTPGFFFAAEKANAHDCHCRLLCTVQSTSMRLNGLSLKPGHNFRPSRLIPA